MTLTIKSKSCHKECCVWTKIKKNNYMNLSIREFLKARQKGIDIRAAAGYAERFAEAYVEGFEEGYDQTANEDFPNGAVDRT